MLAYYSMKLIAVVAAPTLLGGIVCSATSVGEGQSQANSIHLLPRQSSPGPECTQ